ncbi:DUF221-domain-containing protein [Macrolepiota fuliginosa MF-IS2]|uniref:DUF221-domain-containing protein n=1 Tax=Macrolepiota fuliginosa MF-IS2 TaxID=1400762 RepID=A0A9P5XL31_9AGAR|nr:DUF221-domain-containing protein [Macrolepiota fuliginosa MF-IS2]
MVLGVRNGLDDIESIFNAGRKLEPAAVGLQWLLMLVCSFLVIFAFTVLRPGNKIIYQPKVKYHVGDKAPPHISSNFSGWILPLFHTKDPELVCKVGVDAVVFLRFVRLLRWLFLIIAIFTCVILVPIDYVYNIQHRPEGVDVLSALSIRDVKGPMLYAHVGLTYFITLVVILLVNYHWKGVLELRTQWFHSPEYLHSFYARTICITQVHPRYQSDQGINDILASVRMPYPATAVHIGRNVGKLPDLIEYHNNTVRELECVLVKYLRKGKLGKRRPTIRIGGWWCFGGQKQDAITFYTNKLRKTEASINECRARIDTRQPTNYGFASLAAVPHAHVVAKELSGKHPRGVDIELAPNPRDIIWSNITEKRGSRGIKMIIGFLWLVFICILSLVPLFFAATLANLDVITQTGYLPFLTTWSNNSPWTYTIASATLPPLAAGITTFFLPRIMRRLSKYMGAFTRSHLDRAVIARYFAFSVISQLLIFTLIGVGFNVILEIIKDLESPGAKLSTVFSEFTQLPRNISRTYVNQAGYWLKWFPLRGLLTLIDLMQLPSLIWIPLKTYFFGRTPRDIREWTKPPTFEYAIYYSNLLLCAAVALLFAPLAPLVVLAAALVFWGTSWVFKYQLMYIFVTQAETGGRLWNVVINRLLACAIFMQLLMILTIGLQYNFALKQTLLTVPSVLIILGFKVYIHRVYLRRFRFFIPNEQDFASIASYSANVDMMSQKLERRFEHPALHAELFTPMLHQKMMPLLREVYRGRIEEEEEKPFIHHQSSFGSGFRSIPAPLSPGFKLGVAAQVMLDILFRGVDQNDLEYDPSLYARDFDEIDWEAAATPPPAYEETPRPRHRARLQRQNRMSSGGQEDQQGLLDSPTEYRPPPAHGYHQYPPNRASHPQFSGYAQQGSQGSQGPRHYASWSAGGVGAQHQAFPSQHTMQGPYGQWY